MYQLQRQEVWFPRLVGEISYFLHSKQRNSTSKGSNVCNNRTASFKKTARCVEFVAAAWGVLRQFPISVW